MILADWTRAETRALIGAVLSGALLGMAVVGLCHGEVTPDSARAQLLARAAASGYVRAQSAPAAKSRRVGDGDDLAQARSARPFPARRGDLDCLAQAVYYEARGESAVGQAAVAQVVLNRARDRGYPKSVCGVVYQGRNEAACQFAFVCNGAMTRAREPAAWSRARRVAARALGGYVVAAVGKALCFHAARGGRAPPPGQVRLGGQVFAATAAHLRSAKATAA